MFNTPCGFFKNYNTTKCETQWKIVRKNRRIVRARENELPLQGIRRRQKKTARRCLRPLELVM
jgi:hypothetical protein